MSKENFIMVPYKEIGVEITRKCNLKCRHCMRGEAQNHTISKPVIDKFLDEIEIACSLILTGGEPFLEPEIIEYLFDEIIRRKIKILRFSCVTNGTIKDINIANSWNKLSEYIFENYSDFINEKAARMIGRITVSRDDYHENDAMDTVKFYREHLNKHCISVPEKIKKDEKIYMLGRATQDENLKHSKNVIYHVCPYRLEMDDNFILTNIMVGYDGKIMIGEDSSYEQQDKVNYGNIMEHHLSELMLKGFLEEPFIRKESAVYDFFYTKLKTEDFNEDMSKEYCSALLNYFNMVWSAREAVRKEFPFLTYDEIVEAAYDDINLNLRKTDNDPKIYKIDTLKNYDKTLKQSQENCDNIKIRSLLENNTLLHNTYSIHPVPVKEW